MNKRHRLLKALAYCCPHFGSFVVFVTAAYAYIDPGTTGLLSQVLYVLFYGALGVFLYFSRKIKTSIAQLLQTVAKRFRR